MTVDTAYWDLSYYPGMGGSVDPDAPVITFPVNGLTVPPVHDVSGTAQPGQTVELWSALNDAPLAKHGEVVADADGNFTFTGEQITGRDGDKATFEARTDTGTSPDVVVTVRGPVVTGIDPATIAAGTAGSFTLSGERFLTMTRTMQVLITEDGGTKTRVDPDSITATEVAFTATLADEGTATIELAEGTSGPRMTDSVSVTVTAAAPATQTVAPDDVSEATHDAEGIVADPTTPWAAGASALFDDGEFYWDGTAWQPGVAPAEDGGA